MFFLHKTNSLIRKTQFSSKKLSFPVQNTVFPVSFLNEYFLGGGGQSAGGGQAAENGCGHNPVLDNSMAVALLRTLFCLKKHNFARKIFC